MPHKTTPPVLIAGAGLTGLMLAFALTRSGTDFRIIDPLPASPPPSPQNSHPTVLLPRTLELLAAYDLLSPLLEKGHKLLGWSLFDPAPQPTPIDFDRVDSSHPFALVLQKTDLLLHLENALAQSGKSVERGTSLSGFRMEKNTVSCRLEKNGPETEQTSFRFLAGCDGANSTTRLGLDSKLEAELDEQPMVVADVELGGSLRSDRGSVFIHPEGLTFFLPLRPGSFRIYACIQPLSSAKGVVKTELKTIISRRIHPTLQLLEIDHINGVNIRSALAPQFSKKNVFLLGDAAHTHSPADSQGINSGLQDSINLAWKLSAVLHDDAPAALLETYSEERLPIARNLMHATLRMGNLSQRSDRSSLHSWKDKILSLINVLPPIENTLARDLSQVSVHYRQGPLTLEQRDSFQTRSQMRAGERLPNAEIIADKDRRFRLYDVVKNHGFHLFVAPKNLDATGTGSYGEARALVDILKNDFRGPLHIHWVLTPRQSPELAAELPDHLIDLGGCISHPLGISPCGIALIRPDYYCAFASNDFDPSAIRQSLLFFWA